MTISALSHNLYGNELRRAGRIPPLQNAIIEFLRLPFYLRDEAISHAANRQTSTLKVLLDGYFSVDWRGRDKSAPLQKQDFGGGRSTLDFFRYNQPIA